MGGRGSKSGTGGSAVAPATPAAPAAAKAAETEADKSAFTAHLASQLAHESLQHYANAVKASNGQLAARHRKQLQDRAQAGIDAALKAGASNDKATAAAKAIREAVSRANGISKAWTDALRAGKSAELIKGGANPKSARLQAAGMFKYLKPIKV